MKIEKRALRFPKIIVDLSISPWRSLCFCFTYGEGPLTRMAFLGPSQRTSPPTHPPQPQDQQFWGRASVQQAVCMLGALLDQPAGLPLHLPNSLLLYYFSYMVLIYIYLVLPVSLFIHCHASYQCIACRVKLTPHCFTVCLWSWTLKHFSVTCWHIIMSNSASRGHLRFTQEEGASLSVSSALLFF